MTRIHVFELNDPARQNPFDPPLPAVPGPLMGRAFGSYAMLDDGEDWQGPFPSPKAAEEAAFLRLLAKRETPG